MANNSTTSSSSNGIGLVGLLGIVFVVLKLTHVIAWSWWLVLLPFYVGLIIAAVALLIWGVCSAITAFRKRA